MRDVGNASGLPYPLNATATLWPLSSLAKQLFT
ncbi:hypothetical protein HDF11_001984 [Tunturiibacter psychrotolerans]